MLLLGIFLIDNELVMTRSSSNMQRKARRIVIDLFLGSCQGLTHEDIERTGTAVGFTPSELYSLEREDLEESILFLGKDKLSIDQAHAVWKALVREYGDAGNIPDKMLQQMGWVMRGIPPEDVGNLSLNELDTITAFGKYHDLSHKQIEALAEQLRCTWTAKEPEDYTYFDLRAMQHILCGFNRSEIERIHPLAYKEAAESLGQLRNCSTAVLQALATLALDVSAFGTPASWTTTQVNLIGCVLGGLDEDNFVSIPSALLAHLPVIAVRCMPKTLRKVLSQKLPEKAQQMLSTGKKKFTQDLHSNNSETNYTLNKSSHQSLNYNCLIILFIILRCTGSL